MVSAYRIFKTKFARTWDDGEGAFRYGGRWNTRGTRLLYLSSSLALATLEILVNLGEERLLDNFSYVELQLEESAIADVDHVKRLPPNWNECPPPLAVQHIGDEWASSRSSLILRVPSAVIPTESNFLINCEHDDFSSIGKSRPKVYSIDRRLRSREK